MFQGAPQKIKSQTKYAVIRYEKHFPISNKRILFKKSYGKVNKHSMADHDQS